MISVTELITWRHCQRQHWFKYVKGLQPLAPAFYALSGTVVHEAVRAYLKGETEDMLVYAEGVAGRLAEAMRPDDAEALIKRFLPGIKRALKKVPQWVLDGRNNKDWFVEQNIEWEGFGGRPDLFVVSDEAVELLEIKTTALDTRKPAVETLGEYVMWNAQHRYYGVILSKTLGLPVWFKYLVLPTGEGKAAESMSTLLSDGLLEESALEMHEVAAEMTAWANKRPLPNYGRDHCQYCDFAEICRGWLTGADINSIMETRFTRRD